MVPQKHNPEVITISGANLQSDDICIAFQISLILSTWVNKFAPLNLIHRLYWSILT